MKKYLVMIGLLLSMCIFGACAGTQTEEASGMSMTAEEALYYSEDIVEQFNQLFMQGDVESTIQQLELYNGPVLSGGLASWVGLLDEIGLYEGIETSYISEENSGSDSYVAVIKINGTFRDATVEVELNDTGYQSITMSADYTFGEKMQKGGMNTLIGMGTVFCLLILISFIISLFRFIPGSGKLPGQAADKKSASEKPAVSTVDKTVSQIEQREGQSAAELSNSNGDMAEEELIAVITAAIAAYEDGRVVSPGVIVSANAGDGSLDTFVVRSIRRH